MPLRVAPHRGDVVAAGAVVLATLVYLLSARFDSEWGAGIHLLYSAAAATGVGAMALLSVREEEAPRTYQSILYVATFALAIAALVNLAEVLGAQDGLSSAGTFTWVGALLTALAAYLAVERNSAVCTLLGAVAAGVTVEAFADWTMDIGVRTARWILLGLFVAYGLAALGQRDRRRRHAVQLVNATGLAALAIALSYAVAAFLGLFSGGGSGFGVAGGWELFFLAAGCGLVAYASVDHEAGPGYLGVAVLLAFVIVTAEDGSFLGWPLLLLLAAGALLAAGLRPSQPLPPEPGSGGGEPPPVTTIRVP